MMRYFFRAANQLEAQFAYVFAGILQSVYPFVAVNGKSHWFGHGEIPMWRTIPYWICGEWQNGSYGVLPRFERLLEDQELQKTAPR
jgi:hypothetical protein